MNSYEEDYGYLLVEWTDGDREQIVVPTNEVLSPILRVYTPNQPVILNYENRQRRAIVVAISNNRMLLDPEPDRQGSGARRVRRLSSSSSVSRPSESASAESPKPTEDGPPDDDEENSPKPWIEQFHQQHNYQRWLAAQQWEQRIHRPIPILPQSGPQPSTSGITRSQPHTNGTSIGHFNGSAGPSRSNFNTVENMLEIEVEFDNTITFMATGSLNPPPLLSRLLNSSPQPSESSDPPTQPSESSDPSTQPLGSSDPPPQPSGSSDPAPQPSGSSDPPPQPSGSSDPPPQPSGLSDRPPQPSGSSDRPAQPSGSSDRPPQQSGSVEPPPQPSGSSDLPPQSWRSSCPPSRPSGSSDPPPQPSTSSDLPSQLSTLSDLPSQLSMLSDPPSQPSTSLDLPPQPSTSSDLPPQPLTSSDLPPQPSTSWGMPSQLSTSWYRPSEPSTSSDLLSHPSELRSQPSTLSDLSFQPSTSSDLPSPPSTSSDLPSQPSGSSDLQIVQASNNEPVITSDDLKNALLEVLDLFQAGPSRLRESREDHASENVLNQDQSSDDDNVLIPNNFNRTSMIIKQTGTSKTADLQTIMESVKENISPQSPQQTSSTRRRRRRRRNRDNGGNTRSIIRPTSPGGTLDRMTCDRNKNIAHKLQRFFSFIGDAYDKGTTPDFTNSPQLQDLWDILGSSNRSQDDTQSGPSHLEPGLPGPDRSIEPETVNRNSENDMQVSSLSAPSTTPSASPSLSTSSSSSSPMKKIRTEQNN